MSHRVKPDPHDYRVIWWGLIGGAFLAAIAMVTA